MKNHAVLADWFNRYTDELTKLSTVQIQKVIHAIAHDVDLAGEVVELIGRHHPLLLAKEPVETAKPEPTPESGQEVGQEPEQRPGQVGLSDDELDASV